MKQSLGGIGPESGNHHQVVIGTGPSNLQHLTFTIPNRIRHAILEPKRNRVPQRCQIRDRCRAGLIADMIAISSGSLPWLVRCRSGCRPSAVSLDLGDLLTVSCRQHRYLNTVCRIGEIIGGPDLACCDSWCVSCCCAMPIGSLLDDGPDDGKRLTLPVLAIVGVNQVPELRGGPTWDLTLVLC